MSAFPDLASALIYCTLKEEKLNASLPANSKLKVKIVRHVLAADFHPTMSVEDFNKIDEALSKIFIVKAGEIEEYATMQEGRALYCELIVKNVVITGTADGDGVFYIRNANALGNTTQSAFKINIAKQSY